MAYGKIFESLYTGSMVGSGINVFALWAYVIASAKPPGTIELNPKILATVFGCDIAEVNDAIEKLCQPDPDSRTKDFDGRRLIPEGQFLYAVPTWEKYNSLRNEIERREQNREAAQRYRSRQRRHADDDDASPTSAQSAHTVCVSSSPCTSPSPSEKNSGTRHGVTRGNATSRTTSDEVLPFDVFWLAYDKKVGRAASERAWKRARIDDRLFPVILEATKAYVAATPDKAFRRHPATWLNQRGWEDEIVQPGTSGRSSTSKCVVPKDLSKEDWGESGPI